MAANQVPIRRCAIYTRKSSEEGLDQAFNSLDAQREACAAYVASQRHEGWKVLATRYDDGGYSGGSMERPALQHLLQDIGAGRIDIVAVYKVDRLTRSLIDFAKIVETFDQAGVSFVSVTQQFNTTTSMGRLTLNILLSFAQFEREVTGERIRDKFAASRKKGLWMGGNIPLGYDLKERKLHVNPAEAKTVRTIFRRYVELACVAKLKASLNADQIQTKAWVSSTGRRFGGGAFSRGALYKILHNRLYIGEAVHKGKAYPGEHERIIDQDLWERVHALLTENRQAKRDNAWAREPSLLCGLVFDDQGNRLSPSHTSKQGKRYRYYVSQAALQYRATRTGSVIRLPAHDLEDLVERHLLDVLRDPKTLLARWTDATTTPELTSQIAGGAVALVAEWPTLAPFQKTRLLRILVRSVIVSRTWVETKLSAAAVKAAILGTLSPPATMTSERTATHAEDTIAVRTAVRLHHAGVKTKLIVTDGSGPLRPTLNSALIKAVARAYVWFQRLIADSTLTAAAIAREHKVTGRYVRQILRLAFLAPDIVEAILAGRQPPELQLHRMVRRLPMAWPEQRRMFGFPSLIRDERMPAIEARPGGDVTTHVSPP